MGKRRARPSGGPETPVEHAEKEGRQLSPEMMSRLEAALDSERRQREHLERRLRDAERRLESALSTVEHPQNGDADLLELKSLLAAEVAAEILRSELEGKLLELEFLANADAEAQTLPSTQQVQRVIQYVNVPEPARATAPESMPGKDWDDKLAAAQMAIEAAEARASHNALQVRKLTEELAAARSEQIRLATEMRSVQDRIGASSATTLAKHAPVEFIAPDPVALPSEPAEEPAANLEDALEAWGEVTIDEHATAQVTKLELAATHEPSLEDALSAWGEPEPQEQDSGLLSALEAFGGSDESSEPVKLDAPLETSSALEDRPASKEVRMDFDELAEVHGEAASAPHDLPKSESEAWASLLEVDTLDRLESPDAPTEQRLAEALMNGAVMGERAPSDHDLIEDIEASEPVEEESRWTPEPASTDEDDETLTIDWATPAAQERYEESEPARADELITPLEEEVANEDPPDAITLTPAESHHASEQEVLVALEAASHVEPPAPAASSTLEGLESAARKRATIVVAEPTIEDSESEPQEDFVSEMATLVQRGADARSSNSSESSRGDRRKSIVNALQRFIGE